VAWFVGQSLLFVALAFVLGLVVGWLIWGRTTRPAAGEAGSEAEKPQPVAVVAAAEPAVAEPAPAVAEPQPAAVEADMDVVAEPEPVAVEPEPVAAEADVVAEPEPVVAEADVAAEPEPVPAEPVVAAEPEPVAAEADPDVIAEPEPVTAEAGSDVVAEPVVTEPQPEPVAAEPEPEPAPEPAPVAVTPDPTPEPVAAAAPVAAAPVAAAPVAAVEAEPLAKPDNLQRIEGIGPKISKVLVSAGIRTYEQLAASDDATLSAILRQGGLRFAPSLPTWGVQAALLAKGDETGFTELTGELVASRRSR
jgi:predicted flap endonuclease-1-like 5' DNA nuclease